MPKFCLFACRSRHEARSSAASTTTSSSSPAHTHADDADDSFHPPARVLTPTGKHFALAQQKERRRRASPPPSIIVPGAGRNPSLFPSTTDVSEKPVDSPVDSLHRHSGRHYAYHQRNNGSNTTVSNGSSGGSRPHTVYAAADSPVSNMAPTIRIVSDGATSPTPVDACHYENLAGDDDEEDYDYRTQRSATLRDSPSPDFTDCYDSRPSTAFFDAESHLRFGGNGRSCVSLGRYPTAGQVPVAPVE